MSDHQKTGSLDRRKFIGLSIAAAGSSLLKTTSVCASESLQKNDQLDHRHEAGEMTYRKLGRTNFVSSRLVFGCGAALSGGKAVRLLDRAFEAGINNYDIGSDTYYKESERSFAPFFKKHRDKIWVSSKAPLQTLRVNPDDEITVEQAKTAAKSWTKLLDASLKDLGTEYVDAYYLMAVNNVKVIKSDELYQAFLDAKAAGKTGYFGISTHNNAENLLKAAIETGWYDIAMIGITPKGWYDWKTKELKKGTPPLTQLQPLLQKARAKGIGLVGMKSVRYLAPMKSAGKGDSTAFDDVYQDEFKQRNLNQFQKAYTYVLEHGLDVVNSDMQNFRHLEENIVSAQSATNDIV